MADTENLEQTRQLLNTLRHKRPARHKVTVEANNFGERVSDAVTSLIGSWKFIVCQAVILACWIVVNVIGWIQQWDPYPFILLNLLLSFQAAFTAPIIMMSQNRQSAIDRKRAEHDYDVNIKAELEIEQLHEKIDLLREMEMKRLIDVIGMLEAKIDQMSARKAD